MMLVLSSFSYRRARAHSLGVWGCRLTEFPVVLTDFDLAIAISTARPAQMGLQHEAAVTLGTWCVFGDGIVAWD